MVTYFQIALRRKKDLVFFSGLRAEFL
jgi:hypothetical protein